jgi:trimeric autotransporter adhesin
MRSFYEASRAVIVFMALSVATPGHATNCLLDTNQDGTATAATDTTGGAQSGTGDLACGEGAIAQATSTAIGPQSRATNDGATAVGNSAKATGTYAVAVGNEASATKPGAVAIGGGFGAFPTSDFTSATGSNAIAIGSNAKAVDDGAVAIGRSASGNGAASVAIGYNAKSSGEQSTAFGFLATAAANLTSAFGTNTVADNTGSTSVGAAARASGVNATSLGSFANATHNNSTAVGALATTTRDNQVMLGSTGTSVSIADIAASDAAQVGPEFLLTVDSSGTMGRGSQVATIADLQTQQVLVDDQLATLQRRADGADGGIAAAMAMGGMMVVPNSRVTLNFNLATYRGEQGFAGGVVGRLAPRIYVNAVVAGSSQKKSAGGRVGIAFGL